MIRVRAIDQERPIKIGSRRVEKLQLLGEGAFGKVFKVKEQGSGRIFALKQIDMSSRSFAYESLLKEVNTLQKCISHDHIVTLYDVGSNNGKALILMEYCEGGNLNSRLAKPGITADLKLRWMIELADALRFLHSKSIVHRDLKPENVLLSSEDSIKLGDFGLAREYTALRNRNAIAMSDRVYMSYLTDYYMGTGAGTVYWMAPEVFDYQYRESADVFSLGAIFFAIQTGDYITITGEKYFGAFVTSRDTILGIGQAMYEDPATELPVYNINPRSRRELIQEMISFDPHQRPSAKQVYEKLKVIQNGAFTVRQPEHNEGSRCC